MKLNEMANETEIKLSTMNALRKFSNSYVQSEEDKMKKRRKIQNEIKAQSMKEKRSLNSSLNLLKEIVEPDKLDSEVIGKMMKTGNFEDIAIKITLLGFNTFLEEKQQTPRFYLVPLQILISKDIFEKDALDVANETVEKLKNRAALTLSKNNEQKEKKIINGKEEKKTIIY